MRVKKYLALTLVALFAATMLTGCPWDIEDDAASDSSSAPSSSSRPSHDSDSSDDGSAPSSPSTPDDEESENPNPIETLNQYGTVKDDTLTLTTGTLNSDFRTALNNAPTIKKIVFGNSIKSISASAFYGCTNLTSVDLSTAETIDAGAFSGCTNLAHIRLGDGMKEYSDGALFSEPTGVHPDAFINIADTVHVYYGKTADDAETKWNGLGLNYNGTVIPHPASDWEKRENNDNAADVLPDAMKGLLALTERLG